VAEGLRNPFRFTFRPDTSELWIGDVGAGTWEEIDRMPSPTTFTNFGWPCYEGAQQSGNSSLGLCQGLYAAGSSAVAAPYYAYQHGVPVVSGETCPTGNGSSITGIAFASAATTYPAPYNTALFFADHSRNCIWAMLQGTNGLPDPANRVTLDAGAANPVDLQVGPDGNLYYADLDGGTIRRISGTQNRPPVDKATASPTSGAAPLTAQFDATSSSDPDGDRLSYSWDLDGDGVYGDATSPTPSHTYTQNGQVNVGLQVSDGRGGVGTAHVTITVRTSGGPPPTTTPPAVTPTPPPPVSSAPSGSPPPPGMPAPTGTDASTLAKCRLLRNHYSKAKAVMARAKRRYRYHRTRGALRSVRKARAKVAKTRRAIISAGCAVRALGTTRDLMPESAESGR
jgi:PKD repeat protein